MFKELMRIDPNYHANDIFYVNFRVVVVDVLMSLKRFFFAPFSFLSLINPFSFLSCFFFLSCSFLFFFSRLSFSFLTRHSDIQSAENCWRTQPSSEPCLEPSQKHGPLSCWTTFKQVSRKKSER